MRYKKKKTTKHMQYDTKNIDDEPFIEDSNQKFARELFGLFLIFWGLLVLLSLLSYDQRDPSLNHAVSNFSKAYNHAGIFGAYISGLLVDIFGFSALVWPIIFITWGLGCVSTWVNIPWWKWIGFILLSSCLISFGAAWNIGIGDFRGGGVIGLAIYNSCILLFGNTGSTIIWLFLFFISLEFAFGIAWLNIIIKLQTLIKEKFEKYDIISSIWTFLSKQSLPYFLYSYFSKYYEKKSNIEIIPLYDIHEPLLAINQIRIPLAVPIMPISAYCSEKSYKTSPNITPQEINTSEISTTSQYSLYQEPLQEIASTTSHNTINHNIENEYPYPSLTSNDASYPKTQKEQSSNSLIKDHQQLDQTKERERDDHSLEGKILSTNSNSNNKQPNLTSISVKTISDFQTPSQTVEKPFSAIDTKTTSQKAINKPTKKLSYPSHLLLNPSPEKNILPSPLILKEKSKLLMDCLADFNIQGELVRITPGPVITLFEIRPAPGIRVNRIANLSDDLARSLMAEAVRIQAPIPGNDTVGIEIPNANRSPVHFKSLIKSPEFQNSASPLSMALGKDIEGQPTIKDLVTMPHILVAGTTGSGKSVCLNTILLSFLYKASPEKLRLMLIDPKRVELAMYTNLPHLVHPVVTETNLAKTALEWAVYEMDRRYSCLAQLGVKHILDFNKKILSLSNPQATGDLEYLPYLVIVIDELADLMMTAGKEVEASIVRLAQLARAAGIHLIVATQRPSVDVVTGLIKANFPSRIAFQVANKYDSRTILDTTGAEQLLGKGDMIFKPNGGKLQRLHGAFVTDEEVHAITEHWRNQQSPQYDIDFSEWNNTTNTTQTLGLKSQPGSSNEETLYTEAVLFVKEQGRMSISLLQRRFRIGFNKAARFVERMEEEGILPPAARGNKARTVKFT